MLRQRVRAALLASIAVLYVVSIPWYRPAGEGFSLWFGLPDWVTAALLAYLAVALLNAAAWLMTDIPDREDDAR